MIALVVGTGPGFGTGHTVRMRELARLLAERGLSTQFLGCSGENSALDPDSFSGSERWRLAVVDARDLNPEPFSRGCPVIALDNRCPARFRPESQSAVIYHDTLPHPELPIETACQNLLVRPSLTAGPSSRRSRCVVIYAGSLITRPEVTGMVRFLERQNFEPIVLDGVRRRPAREVDRLMLSARALITYPGMTLMEAWYCGALPIVVGTRKPLHRAHARDLAAAGVPMLEKPDCPTPLRDYLRQERLSPLLARTRPGASGYARLIDLILGKARPG